MRVGFFLILGLAFLTGSGPAKSGAQLKILPGSAARGEQLLTDKGCIDCHRQSGQRAGRPPDLSRTPPDAGTPSMLASAMWNHAPSMWAARVAVEARKSELTSIEAADLFAYMYSALYFAPAGDVTRGKDVFEKKNCINCHGEHPAGATAARSISTWTAVKDPVSWAGRMWNHSSEMSSAILGKKFAWPKLSSEDVADLMIYLRSLPALRRKSATLALGEPELGRIVFERSCESCHSFGPGLGKTIDLLRRRAPHTVTGYIAAMWNHAPIMRAGGQFPTLEPEEMPNLVAFLFSQSYFFERGNAARGRSIFENKSCAGCHEQRRIQTKAPDLSQSTELYSPITLTSAVWRHGPEMFDFMKRNGIAWPRFQGTEMADVIAYLNSRVIVRIARP